MCNNPNFEMLRPPGVVFYPWGVVFKPRGGRNFHRGGRFFMGGASIHEIDFSPICNYNILKVYWQFFCGSESYYGLLYRLP